MKKEKTRFKTYFDEEARNRLNSDEQFEFGFPIFDTVIDDFSKRHNLDSKAQVELQAIIKDLCLGTLRDNDVGRELNVMWLMENVVGGVDDDPLGGRNEELAKILKPMFEYTHHIVDEQRALEELDQGYFMRRVLGDD